MNFGCTCLIILGLELLQPGAAATCSCCNTTMQMSDGNCGCTVLSIAIFALSKFALFVLSYKRNN